MKRITAALSALFCLLLCACSGSSFFTDQGSTGYPQVQVVPAVTQQALKGAVLYYRYGQEAYLAGVMCDISAVGTGGVSVLLDALLAGPQVSGLTAVIPQGTRVLNITDNKQYLYITLSGSFLTLPDYATNNWKQQPELAQRVYLQQRLALYSIINTITENTQYKRVQISVDVNGDGQAEHLLRRELGLVGDGLEEQQAGALPRSTELMLTPYNTACLALDCITENRIDTLYSLSAAGRTALPAQSDFVNAFNASRLTLLAFSVRGETLSISADAQKCVLLATLSVRYGGTVNEYADVPVTLFRNGELWRVSYDFITGYLEQSL